MITHNISTFVKKVRLPGYKCEENMKMHDICSCIKKARLITFILLWKLICQKHKCLTCSCQEMFGCYVCVLGKVRLRNMKRTIISQHVRISKSSTTQQLRFRTSKCVKRSKIVHNWSVEGSQAAQSVCVQRLR